MVACSFVASLKICMQREGLANAEKLAWRLGLSRTTTYNWLTGASLPSAEHLVKLSREFSVSIDWLLGISEASEVAR